MVRELAAAVAACHLAVHAHGDEAGAAEVGHLGAWVTGAHALDGKAIAKPRFQRLEAVPHAAVAFQGAKRHTLMACHQFVGAMDLGVACLAQVCGAPITMQVGLARKQNVSQPTSSVPRDGSATYISLFTHLTLHSSLVLSRTIREVNDVVR